MMHRRVILERDPPDVPCETEAVVKDAAYWTEWHLQNWCNWMHGRDLPDGMPDEACGGIENYTSYDHNNERAYEKLDAWAAELTHLVIHGLVESEQAAIYHAYVNAVYRFMRGNYHELLLSARANVQAGLRRRGIWLGE